MACRRTSWAICFFTFSSLFIQLAWPTRAEAQSPVLLSYYSVDPLPETLQQTGGGIVFRWHQPQHSVRTIAAFIAQFKNKARAECRTAGAKTSINIINVDLEHWFVAGPFAVECGDSGGISGTSLPSDNAIAANVESWQRVLEHSLLSGASSRVRISFIISTIYRKALLNSAGKEQADKDCPILNVSEMLLTLGVRGGDKEVAAELAYPLCILDVNGRVVVPGLDVDQWFWGNAKYRIDSTLKSNLQLFEDLSEVDMTKIPRYILRAWVRRYGRADASRSSQTTAVPIKLDNPQFNARLEWVPPRGGPSQVKTLGFRVLIDRQVQYQENSAPRTIKSSVALDNEKSLTLLDYQVRRDLLRKATTILNAIVFGEIGEVDATTLEFRLLLLGENARYAQCDLTACRTVDVSEGSRRASLSVSLVQIQEPKLQVRTDVNGSECVATEEIPKSLTLIATESPPWRSSSFCDVRIDQSDEPLFSEDLFYLKLFEARHRGSKIKHTLAGAEKDKMIRLFRVDCSQSLAELDLIFQVHTASGAKASICNSQ